MPIKQLTSGTKGDIKVYVDDAGRCEVQDFIEALSASDQKKVLNLFRLFCEQGEIRNEEKFRHEDGSIYAFKSFQIRILCGFLPVAGKRTVVLLHALKKKTDKLSKSDLKKAKQLFDTIRESN